MGCFLGRLVGCYLSLTVPFLVMWVVPEDGSGLRIPLFIVLFLVMLVEGMDLRDEQKKDGSAKSGFAEGFWRDPLTSGGSPPWC